MPGAEKVAVVSAAAALPKVTVPGPEARDQVLVNEGGAGRPSSVMVPSRDAEAGRVICWSGPALTTGGVLPGVAGLTVTVTSSWAVRAPSLAVSRST